MLYSLIILFVTCMITITDEDVSRDTFSTYFVGFVMMFDIVAIAYQIIKIIVR